MTRCKNPTCRRPVFRNGNGRPRQYCDKPCRDAAYRAGRLTPSPDTERYAAYLRQLSEDLAQRAHALVVAAHGAEPQKDASLTLLRLVTEAERALGDVRAAAVQHARTRGVRAVAIAQAIGLTPAQLRTRLAPPAVERRMRRREALARHPDPAPGQPEQPVVNAPPPGAFPLARALATLQRSSGRSLSEVGRRAGVSPSYVSRVLAGKRRPSWPLTRRIVEVCDGDPADLLPLWRAARGEAPRPATPDALHAALRGLHLAAQRPPLESIRTASHGQLSTADIAGLLHGQRVPHRTVVDRFVQALGFRPEAYLPPWGTERPPGAARPGVCCPTPGALPADAFG
ncbi:helix-turn-helix domain-containing protein [Streptomyces radicis]|nr:helix-turn-helix transcriptional regulator [Streptomyces radicis]